MNITLPEGWIGADYISDRVDCWLPFNGFSCFFNLHFHGHSIFNWINCNKRRSLRNSITHFKSTFRYKRCTITQETKNAETKIFLLNYLVDHCLWTGGTNKMRQGVCFGGGRTHSQVAQENQSSDFDRNLPAEMTVTQQSGRQIFSITNSLLVRFTFSLQSFWREIHKHRVKCIQIWGFSFGWRH